MPARFELNKANTRYSLLIYWDPESLKPETPEAPEEERRRNVNAHIHLTLALAANSQQVTFSDPVHRVHVKEFVKGHLQNLIMQCGGREAFQRSYLVHIDQDVIKSFSELDVL